VLAVSGGALTAPARSASAGLRQRFLESTNRQLMIHWRLIVRSQRTFALFFHHCIHLILIGIFHRQDRQ